MCFTCTTAELEADAHCVYVSALTPDRIVSFVCAPQGDVELEPSRGAKCSAAVRRVGTQGSATGKR